MDTNQFLLPDDEATRTLGARLARELTAGDLVTLSGPLGAGKTTLAQGLARGLDIVEPVTSPTYVLINEYPGPLPLLHLDAYRLEEVDDEILCDAGIDEMLLRQDAVKLVEWPERIMPWLLTVKFAITLEWGPDGGRKVTVVRPAAPARPPNSVGG